MKAVVKPGSRWIKRDPDGPHKLTKYGPGEEVDVPQSTFDAHPDIFERPEALEARQQEKPMQELQAYL